MMTLPPEAWKLASRTVNLAKHLVWIEVHASTTQHWSRSLFFGFAFFFRNIPG
jgi:hypothetical protein